MHQKSLAIYLRNHDAAAQAGMELFRRAERNQRDRPYGSELAELRAEVEQDARALRSVLKAEGVQPDRAQSLVLLLGERVGRLKPNGSLLRRAPLSDLIEVEGMLDAVRAKAAGWQALTPIPAPRWRDEVDPQEYYDRAMSQAERLNTIHRSVATRLFTP
ncbi:MAG TPA: hypothetical protein VE476_12505 [Propionibacteriaceae bacterium]|jgi:hypothetical protein|nr:hypothetical protein [Propionibacteriaceae bacterium]